jgi:hypothetical protein
MFSTNDIDYMVSMNSSHICLVFDNSNMSDCWNISGFVQGTVLMCYRIYKAGLHYQSFCHHRRVLQREILTHCDYRNFNNSSVGWVNEGQDRRTIFPASTTCAFQFREIPPCIKLGVRILIKTKPCSKAEKEQNIIFVKKETKLCWKTSQILILIN